MSLVSCGHAFPGSFLLSAPRASRLAFIPAAQRGLGMEQKAWPCSPSGSEKKCYPVKPGCSLAWWGLGPHPLWHEPLLTFPALHAWGELPGDKTVGQNGLWWYQHLVTAQTLVSSLSSPPTTPPGILPPFEIPSSVIYSVSILFLFQFCKTVVNRKAQQLHAPERQAIFGRSLSVPILQATLTPYRS